MLKNIKIKEAVKKGIKTRPESFIDFDDEVKEMISSLTQSLLAVSAFAGVALISVIAPNAIQLLSKLPKLKKWYRNGSDEESITKAFYYLKSRGYIKLRPEGKDIRVEISQKGRKKILKMRLDNLQIKSAEPWDGCWWVVLGDIPTEARYEAGRFRFKLKEFGFYPLQRTVWLYPYDPRNEIDFVSASFGLDRFITVLRADCLDSDDEKKLKRHFKGLNLI